MVMTGSDLCASTKPWGLQLETVEDIYREFYNQGDYEIESGRLPLPIMNRFHQDEKALHQVGFFGGICLPCYELLAELLPGARPLLDQCADNLASWKKLAEEKKSEKQDG